MTLFNMPTETKNKADKLLKQLRQMAKNQPANKRPDNDDDTLKTESTTSRIIEMAWEDRTPFEAIEHQFALKEADVISLMRSQLHPSSFKLWRKRVTGRVTKHQAIRPDGVTRAYCPTQYKHR